MHVRQGALLVAGKTSTGSTVTPPLARQLSTGPFTITSL